MNRTMLCVVATVATAALGGCHSAELNPAISQLWLCHASAKHDQVVESSWAMLVDGSATLSDRCTCLFLCGDSLRQLGRFTEAQAALDRATSCSEVFWLDHAFTGKIALGPQLRLSRALIDAKDPTVFPASEAEYVDLMLAYYGTSKPFADQVAQACASACVAKNDAMHYGD